MPFLSEVVDTRALLESVAASFVAGLGVTLAFAFALLGFARFADLRAEDRPLAAGMFAGLAMLAFAVVVGAIVTGIVVMLSK